MYREGCLEALEVAVRSGDRSGGHAGSEARLTRGWRTVKTSRNTTSDTETTR